MPWMTWSPKGDRVAYFVRTEKERTLIIENVLTTQDRGADRHEDGRRARVAVLLARRPDDRVRRAAQRHRRHLHGRPRDAGGRQPHERRRSPTSGRPTRPTASSSSTTRASAATRSCSGSTSTRRRRRSSPSGRRTRPAAQFIDDHTIVFSSTATDPNVPLEPEVAKNGNIYNIWTLDLKTGELRQYTDTLGGNLSPVVLNQGKTSLIAFVTYYKGDYGIHTLERKEPLHTAATSDFGAPGPIIDFQAPLQHTLVEGEHPEEGRVREDVPRGAPADQRRRDEQRRHLRRHGDQLRRRARRQAVQLLRLVDRAVPDAGAVVREPGAAVPVRRPGLLADAVLLRAARRALLRPDAHAVHQPRPRHRDAHGARRRRSSASTRSTATAAWRSRAASCSSTSSTTIPSLQQLSEQYQQQAYGRQVVPERHDGAASSVALRAGDDGVPRIRAARRQHDAAGVRRGAEARQHALAPDASTATRATTCGSAARGVLATRIRGVQEHRRLPRLHLLRRQLRDARLRLPAVRRAERRLRATPSCASRSSKRR